MALGGPQRERAAFTLRGTDGKWAIAVLDLAPEWWNLSALSTGLRVFGPAASSPEFIAVACAIAADWFNVRGRAWTVLVPATAGVLMWLDEMGHAIADHILPTGIAARSEAMWNWKLDTVGDALVAAGWTRVRTTRLIEGMHAHVRDPATFSYSTLITIGGIVTRPQGSVSALAPSSPSFCTVPPDE